MPTNSQKLDELTALVHRLVSQLEAVSADVKRLERQREQDYKSHEELKTAVHRAEIQAAVMARDVEDLKKSRESWGQRTWQLGIGLLLAVVGGVIGYLLKR